MLIQSAMRVGQGSPGGRVRTSDSSWVWTWPLNLRPSPGPRGALQVSVGTARTLAVVSSTGLSLALCGCSVEPDHGRIAEACSAIVGGFHDADDRGIMGVVLMDPSGVGRHLCTAALITPNLVLTAQHCIADTLKHVDCASAVFGEPIAPQQISVTTSETIWASDASWHGVENVLTPPGPRLMCGHDVALLVLADALDAGARPLVPRLDEPVRPGELYSAIGYGATSGDTHDTGTRRRGESFHTECAGPECGGDVLEGEWSGDRSSCAGDSGGPAIDQHGMIIGVASRGPESCDLPIYEAISAHAGWVREEARRAARTGGYLEPAWVSGEATDEPARSR